MEKEMQEELVLDLPELLALYLRKGVLILVCRRKRVRLIRSRP